MLTCTLRLCSQVEIIKKFSILQLSPVMVSVFVLSASKCSNNVKHDIIQISRRLMVQNTINFTLLCILEKHMSQNIPIPTVVTWMPPPLYVARVSGPSHCQKFSFCSVWAQAQKLCRLKLEIWGFSKILRYFFVTYLILFEAL